jgi:4-nitrophenyl phosphatase
MTFRGVVVDLDGTVLRDGELIPGAADALAALRERADRVLYLTNNPTVPPADYAANLRDLGLDATDDDVLTAAVATIDYLHAEHDGETVFPIAESSIVDQLRAAGVDVTDDPTEAAVVVVGYHRDFHHDDLQAALDAFDTDEDDMAFVGTDPDTTVPTAQGLKPGSGAIINAVAGVTGRDPDAVLGKPSATTARLAADRLGVPPEDCVLVGDRLDTDVAMGETAGMTTVLVRTGVEDDASTENGGVDPDYVVDSLADVPALLE